MILLARLPAPGRSATDAFYEVAVVSCRSFRDIEPAPKQTVERQERTFLAYISGSNTFLRRRQLRVRSRGFALSPKAPDKFSRRRQILNVLNARARPHRQISQRSNKPGARSRTLVSNDFGTVGLSRDNISFPRSFAGQAASRCFPDGESAISQNAVHHGPAVLEANRKCCVLRGRCHERSFIVRMSCTLRTCNKTRT
jgi:hypothetical protein